MATNTHFGTLLRAYRHHTKHPSRGGSLTQEQFGELIGQACGTSSYSGAAISDWERSRSHIHKDDRKVLVSIIMVLYTNGGLTSLDEANTLLLSGNYRPLDNQEAQQIFKYLPQKNLNEGLSNKEILFSFLSQPFLGLNKFWTRPVWSAALLGIFGASKDLLSPRTLLKTSIWIGLWFISCKTFIPSLQFLNDQFLIPHIWLYGLSAFLIPLLIGLLTSTRDDPFWISQNLNKSWQVRAFTYIGAAAGLNTGFMCLFLANLIYYYLTNLHVMSRVNCILMCMVLLLSAAAAKEIPFNQWRAFNRVSIHDGAIFSIFLIYPFLFSYIWSIVYPIVLNRYIGPILLFFVFVLILLVKPNKKWVSIR